MTTKEIKTEGELLQVEGFEKLVAETEEYCTDFSETEIGIGETYYKYKYTIGPLADTEDIFGTLKDAIAFANYLNGIGNHPFQI